MMKTVLIVDDQSAIRRLLAHWTLASGYDVAEAASAEQALEEMSKCRAAVVVSDVHLPDHDGIWLAGELRRRFPEAALIMTTGAKDANLMRQTGAVECLMKPFKRAQLQAALQRGSERNRA